MSSLFSLFFVLFHSLLTIKFISFLIQPSELLRKEVIKATSDESHVRVIKLYA